LNLDGAVALIAATLLVAEVVVTITTVTHRYVQAISEAYTEARRVNGSVIFRKPKTSA
jgi:hypothetical protein